MNIDKLTRKPIGVFQTIYWLPVIKTQVRFYPDVYVYYALMRFLHHDHSISTFLLLKRDRSIQAGELTRGVFVEAATGFAAEPTGGDIAPQENRCAILGIAEFPVINIANRQQGVEPNQIG